MLTSREKRMLVYFGVLCVILGWDSLRRRWTGHAPRDGALSNRILRNARTDP